MRFKGCGCADGIGALLALAAPASPGAVLEGKRLELLKGRRGRIDIQSLRLSADPARSLGKYYCGIACQPLGAGVYGEVFKVRHRASGVLHAVKVLRKGSAGFDERQVRAELHSLLELDHPHVLRLHDYFEDAIAVYLVTELATGGSLLDLMVDYDEPGYTEEVACVFRQVMQALAYCHARGVAHRDLKGENCLFSNPHERLVKVIDFGLSAVRAPADKTDCWLHKAVGTPTYMSPAVLDGAGAYSLRCDIWSAGVLLYRLLTVEHPFCTPGCNLKQLLHNIRHEPFRTDPLRDSDVGPLASDLVGRMLCKDAVRRPSALEVLKHPWLEQRQAAPPPRLQELYRRVLSFADARFFERALLTIAAHKAGDDESWDLREAFAWLDEDGDGHVSVADLREAFATCGAVTSPAELLRACEGFGHPQGQIQYTAWLAATLSPSAIASDRSAQAAFELFDTRGVGAVAVAGVAGVIGEDHARQAMERWDSDADGLLRVGDFRAAMVDLAERRTLWESPAVSLPPLPPPLPTSPVSPDDSPSRARGLAGG